MVWEAKTIMWVIFIVYSNCFNAMYIISNFSWTRRPYEFHENFMLKTWPAWVIMIVLILPQQGYQSNKESKVCAVNQAILSSARRLDLAQDFHLQNSSIYMLNCSRELGDQGPQLWVIQVVEFVTSNFHAP